MERPIEVYLDQADKLAQDVVNAAGLNTKAGIILTDEFKDLFETTCRFRTAKMVAESYGAAGVVTEQVQAEAEAMRLAFARAYKGYWEKRETYVARRVLFVPAKQPYHAGTWSISCSSPYSWRAFFLTFESMCTPYCPRVAELYHGHAAPGFRP